MKDPFFLYFPYGPLHLDTYVRANSSRPCKTWRKNEIKPNVTYISQNILSNVIRRYVTKLQ